MPAIEVFIGLEAVRASAEVVPGLPSRATIEEWLAKHDSVDKETEIFDTTELEKLRQLTKGRFQRTANHLRHSLRSKSCHPSKSFSSRYRCYRINSHDYIFS